MTAYAYDPYDSLCRKCKKDNSPYLLPSDWDVCEKCEAMLDAEHNRLLAEAVQHIDTGEPN